MNQETVVLYLNAAEEQLKGSKYNLDGGYFGIAISRAYYAFLYGATALLLTRDIVRNKHGAILAAFRQEFIKSGILEKTLSDSFGEAFDLRHVADYDMLTSTDETQATHVLNNAQEFTISIRNYLKDQGYL
jgi:uncharacterized protein (UPF0332 family)